MKILKFTLKGKTAFFKKPEVNSYFYFTYGHIHKVALLGIFGAILGYGGYAQHKKQKMQTDYPEFYQQLKDIKISIVPNNDKAFISKKIQTFNNSVGYASQEQGGNLIVKEQWLEDPSWDIYVLVNDSESEKLALAIINHQCIYQPYLGKNDHFADIDHIELIEDVITVSNISKLDCLTPRESIVFEIVDDFDWDESWDDSFKYEEYLPKTLNIDTHLYQLEPFLYTNMKISKISHTIYQVNNRAIVFY